MQLDPSLFSNEYDDLTDLTDRERATARNWHEDFRGERFSIVFKFVYFRFSFEEKYDIVGRLLRPGEKAQIYPSDDINSDEEFSLRNKKTE